jgi:hypothetical protein
MTVRGKVRVSGRRITDDFPQASQAQARSGRQAEASGMQGWLPALPAGSDRGADRHGVRLRAGPGRSPGPGTGPGQLTGPGTRAPASDQA